MSFHDLRMLITAAPVFAFDSGGQSRPFPSSYLYIFSTNIFLRPRLGRGSRTAFLSLLPFFSTLRLDPARNPSFLFFNLLAVQSPWQLLPSREGTRGLNEFWLQYGREERSG